MANLVRTPARRWLKAPLEACTFVVTAGVEDLSIPTLELRDTTDGLEGVVICACKVVGKAGQVGIAGAAALDEVDQGCTALRAGGSASIQLRLKLYACLIHDHRCFLVEASRANAPIDAAGALLLVQFLRRIHTIDSCCPTKQPPMLSRARKYRHKLVQKLVSALCIIPCMHMSGGAEASAHTQREGGRERWDGSTHRHARTHPYA
jgi:hypothetical protein